MAKANQDVLAAVSRVLAGAADDDARERIGRDLLAIAGVLAHHRRLRSALTDPSLPDEAKRGLAGDVFGDRAAQEAVDCVLAAQANQRLQPGDLVDVLEEVGSQALLDVADERGALAKVQDELFAFAQLVDAETSLRSALTDPAIPAERKRAVVGDLLEGKADDVSVAILAHFVGEDRARELLRLVREMIEEAAARRSAVLAEVRTAVELDADRRERLARALGRITGTRVDLQVVVDPSVVGSLAVRIGDEVYDGTVKRQLELAGENLGAA